MFRSAARLRLVLDQAATHEGATMHPDVHTMEAQARIDERLRAAVQARLAAQARAGRRRRRHHRDVPEVGA